MLWIRPHQPGRRNVAVCRRGGHQPRTCAAKCVWIATGSGALTPALAWRPAWCVTRDVRARGRGQVHSRLPRATPYCGAVSVRACASSKCKDSPLLDQWSR